MPREIWALSPAETDELVAAWNDAQAGDQLAPPSPEEYDELVARYG